MSLKAGKYLNMLESATSSRMTHITQLVESIIEMLKTNGEKTKKPHKEIMEIHGMVFASKPATSSDTELYNRISSLFESYIKQTILPEYFEQVVESSTLSQMELKNDLDQQKLIVIFISHINTIKKLSVWFGLAFKAFQTPQQFADVPLNNQPFHLFGKLVYEHEKVKPVVDSFLESEMKQPSPDPPKGKGVAVHKTLIKTLALMGYTENHFNDSLRSLISTQLEDAIYEEQARRRKSSYESNMRYVPTTRTSYNSSASSSSSSSYTLYNNYPYKSESGHVGLKNQGATCYLNSLVQSLYMTPAFRRAVFNWRYDPNTNKPEKNCIALQLQKLFAKLHLSESKAVETTDLTQSFGWDTRESFIQHDVQELLRVLFDALSETTIPISQLYEGHTQDYVICQQCHRVGGGKDKYLDLQLVIRNIQHLNEAIENYQFEELLAGENQYFCERCSTKVDALKGVKLLDLPDVLTLHLKRFDIDYMTFTRVKLNNEVIFPQTLDMNKHMKSSNDLKVSDIDSKHNIYNLFAVLMHSGGASGGHYYAYIKDRDSWFEFNDSQVTRMDEKDIEKAYGGGSHSGNAYMLMYIRQYPVSTEHIRMMGLNPQEEIALIPEQIRREIEQQNSEYRKGQQEYERKKDSKTTFNIFFKSKRHELSIETGKTVDDLLRLAFEKLVPPNTCQLTDIRLRVYDSQKRVPREILTNGSLLSDIDFTCSGERRNILMEVQPEFINYNPMEELLLHIIKFTYNDTSSSFDPEVSVTVPNTCTSAQLKHILAHKYQIAENKIIVVQEKFVNNVKQQLLITEGESGSIQELYGILEGDILYIEEATVDTSNLDPENSKLIQKLEEMCNTIVLRFDTVGQDIPAVFDHVIRIDKRRTVADLKLEIANIIGLDVDDFKLSFGSADNSYSLKGLDERLNQLANGTKLYVRRGKQMSSQQYNVTFYLMEDERERENKKRRKQEEEKRKEEESKQRFPGVGRSLVACRDVDDFEGISIRSSAKKSHNSHNNASSYPRSVKWEDDEDEGNGDLYHHHYHYGRSSSQSSSKFSKWFDTVLSKSDTVLEIKKMLLEKAKREQAAYVENDSTDFIRLREKLHGRNYPGKVLLDDEEPFRALATTAVSAVPNREIVIERLTYPESLSSNDMVLRIARWYPSKWMIGRVREIIVGRDNTTAELKQFIQPFFNHENCDQSRDYTPLLQLKKIPYHTIAQLRDSEFMLRLDWNDKHLKDTSVVTREPWFLADADLILYRDASEKDWFSLHNYTSPLGNGAAASAVDRVGGASPVRDPTGSAAAAEAEPKQHTRAGSYRRGERALKFYNTTSSTTTTSATQTATTPTTPTTAMATAATAPEETPTDKPDHLQLEQQQPQQQQQQVDQEKVMMEVNADDDDNDVNSQVKKRARDESHAEEGSNKLP